MKTFFLLASLSGAVCVTQASDAQTLPATAQTPVVPVIEAPARSLLDRAVERYSHTRTVQLRAEGFSMRGKTRTPISLDLRFERPYKARVEGQNAGSRGLYVADGKKATTYDDLLQIPTSNTLNDRYNLLTLPFGLRFTDYPIGLYLSGWLFGTHWLQPKELSKMMYGATSFEAKALPTAQVNGKSVEGVRIRAVYRAQGNYPEHHWEHVLWFDSSDGSLVRVQFSSLQGKNLTRGSSDVKSQTFDSPIPASTFVFQKPKWAPSPSY